jgi:protein-L-isoaspartate O-methyltransferase
MTGFGATSPATIAVGYPPATARPPLGEMALAPGRPFPPRASALRAYDASQSTVGEAQMVATAVEAWDERWAMPEGRSDWLVPHPAVAALVPVLKARGTQHVLDLGCGVGRHALLFAEHGFAVEAIDGAAAGLDFACREAAARGLRVSLRQADADALPFADENFDYVLSGVWTRAPLRTLSPDPRPGRKRHPDAGPRGNRHRRDRYH